MEQRYSSVQRMLQQQQGGTSRRSSSSGGGNGSGRGASEPCLITVEALRLSTSKMKSLASQLGLPAYTVIHCLDKQALATIAARQAAQEGAQGGGSSGVSATGVCDDGERGHK